MTLPCNGRGSVLLQGVRASALLTETVAGAHAGFFDPLGRCDLLAGAVADALDRDRAVAGGDPYPGRSNLQDLARLAAAMGRRAIEDLRDRAVVRGPGAGLWVAAVDEIVDF